MKTSSSASRASISREIVNSTRRRTVGLAKLSVVRISQRVSEPTGQGMPSLPIGSKPDCTMSEAMQPYTAQWDVRGAGRQLLAWCGGAEAHNS